MDLPSPAAFRPPVAAPGSSSITPGSWTSNRFGGPRATRVACCRLPQQGAREFKFGLVLLLARPCCHCSCQFGSKFGQQLRPLARGQGGSVRLASGGAGRGGVPTPTHPAGLDACALAA